MSTSALAYNPAALVVGRVYHVEGNFDYMPDMHTVALGGSVIDSSTAQLAAGLSLRGFVGGNGAIGGIDGRIAAAVPLSDAISIGVAGRYINARRDDGTFVEPSLYAVKGFSLDASLRIAPVPTVQLYFGTYNLISHNSVYTPFTLGTGAGVVLGEIAVLSGDVLFDMTSYKSTDVTVGGGLEILLAGSVPLRAGYSYDTKRDQNVLSLGLGYTDRSLGLDLSLRQDLGGAGDTRLMAAFRFYVH
jgi:opacity protein-like surface antigen